MAEQHENTKSSGQGDMFGLAREKSRRDQGSGEVAWSERRRLEEERKSLGLYLSGHPIQYYKLELDEVVDATIAEINPKPERMITIAGLVTGFRSYNTRRGDTIAFMSLDDRTAKADVSIFGELYNQARRLVESESLLVITGTSGIDERTGELQIRANQIHSIQSLRARALAKITISLSAIIDRKVILPELSEILSEAKGGHTSVEIQYQNEIGDAISIDLGEEWKVDVSDILIEELSRLFNKQNIGFVYEPHRLHMTPQGQQDEAA